MANWFETKELDQNGAQIVKDEQTALSEIAREFAYEGEDARIIAEFLFPSLRAAWKRIKELEGFGG